MKKVFIIIVILFSKVSFAIDVDDAIKSTIENNPKVKIAFEKCAKIIDDGMPLKVLDDLVKYSNS